jgi:hypothetical protein
MKRCPRFRMSRFACSVATSHDSRRPCALARTLIRVQTVLGRPSSSRTPARRAPDLPSIAGRGGCRRNRHPTLHRRWSLVMRWRPKTGSSHPPPSAVAGSRQGKSEGKLGLRTNNNPDQSLILHVAARCYDGVMRWLIEGRNEETVGPKRSSEVQNRHPEHRADVKENLHHRRHDYTACITLLAVT